MLCRVSPVTACGFVAHTVRHAPASFAVIIGVGWLVWPPSDPVREQFAHVSRFLTRAECIDLMGREPDVEREAAEGLYMHWQGTTGIGTVVIDHESELVTWRLWIET